MERERFSRVLQKGRHQMRISRCERPVDAINYAHAAFYGSRAKLLHPRCVMPVEVESRDANRISIFACDEVS
jgi:hypothetical protein